MARLTLPPLTDPTVQISTQRVPQTLLPAQFQGWAIRGSNNGWRRRSSTYFSHVSAFPRVRRLSHFRQILQTARGPPTWSEGLRVEDIRAQLRWTPVLARERGRWALVHR